MRLLAIILFSASVALLIIGIHQIMLVGFAASYWIVMLSLTSFLGYGYVKKYKLPHEEILVETKDTLQPKKLNKSKLSRKK